MDTVPEEIKRSLRAALAHADKDKAIQIIESNRLSANSIVDEQSQTSILLDAVNALSQFHGSVEQIAIVEFLLASGADPNSMTSEEYNSLHLALEHHNLSEVALLLITKGGADVNAVESHGNSPLSIAIREYRLTWRPEQEQLREIRFKIVEELLKRGADLDKQNQYGMSPRRWLERIDDQKLLDLVGKYDKSNR